MEDLKSGDKEKEKAKEKGKKKRKKRERLKGWPVVWYVSKNNEKGREGKTGALFLSYYKKVFIK